MCNLAHNLIKFALTSKQEDNTETPHNFFSRTPPYVIAENLVFIRYSILEYTNLRYIQKKHLPLFQSIPPTILLVFNILENISLPCHLSPT